MSSSGYTIEYGDKAGFPVIERFCCAGLEENEKKHDRTHQPSSLLLIVHDMGAKASRRAPAAVNGVVWCALHILNSIGWVLTPNGGYFPFWRRDVGRSGSWESS